MRGFNCNCGRVKANIQHRKSIFAFALNYLELQFKLIKHDKLKFRYFLPWPLWLVAVNFVTSEEVP